MDYKSDEGIFLGYSTNSRTYRVFNSRTKVMMESINVIVNDHHQENNVPCDVETWFETSPQVSDKDDVPVPTSPKSEPEEANKDPSIRIQKDHPKELIIRDPNSGVITRSREIISNSCFVSKIEPKNVKEALTDEYWIGEMQDELNQFKQHEVWELVPRPEGTNIIGTKWIYKNKSDAEGVVTRNKARLVAQGYTQVEGIDFDETFAPVARLESIKHLLGVPCILKFKLFQMDEKSAFLNGYL